jgi:hypothetical protein
MFNKINYVFIGRVSILIIVFVIGYNILFSKKNTIEKFEDSTGDTFNIYRSVIRVFNEFLGRNPNTSELFKYYRKMTDDKIDEKKLGKVLENTDEYKRTQTIANNMTNNDVAVTMNTQQIDTEIIDIYSSLFNKNPDDITIKYFRKKYMEMDFDKKKLQDYMMNLPDYKIQDALIKEATDELEKESNDSMKNLALEQEEVPQEEKKGTKITKKTGLNADDIRVTDGKASYIIERPNIFNFYSDGENSQDMIDNAAKLLSSGITNSTDSITTDNINTNQEDVCKKLDDNTTFCTMRKRKSMAKYEQQRNLDELKYKCKQTKYTNASDDYKLFPEFKWMTPQTTNPVCYGADYSANPLIDQSSLIGTLLPDARKTEVGTILPKFTYNEDATQVCKK